LCVIWKVMIACLALYANALWAFLVSTARDCWNDAYVGGYGLWKLFPKNKM
jgi:hypothetical protein